MSILSTGQFAAGWYPDTKMPEGTLRWWDGAGWTEHLHFQPPAQPSLPAAQEQDQDVRSPFTTALAADAASGAPEAFAAGRQVGAVASSFAQRNSKSLTAMAFVFAYILIAAYTGIVFLGIAPALLSARAYRRREQMAPFAIAAAALAVLLAFSALRYR